MLIWKGHGILILVFSVIGAIASGLAMAALFAATQWNWVGRMIFPANCWGAAIAIWLYAITIGKTVTKTYLDPATHRPVVITNSHSLFFIRPTLWAILASLVASLMTLVALVKPDGNFMDDASAGGSAPATAAFQEANRLIDMDKGKESFGNTPEAEKLAEAFARVVRMGRELGVEKTKKKSSISLSHGKFLSYCRINADSCAFMVHVPDLRKFSDEAKEYIAEVAWSVAMATVTELKPQPKRLAIGIRGAFLYDTVIEGHIVAEDKDAEEGIEQRHTGGSPQKYLEAFFEPNAGNAALPKLEPVDEPEPKAASTAQQMTAPSAAASSPATPSPSAAPKRAAVDAATSASEKVELLLKWFPTTKAGEVAGNADAASQIALKYAGFVHDKVSANPALGGVMLPDPCFSAYVHLRDDTVAFLLALPAGSDLTPNAFKVVQDQACTVAAMLSAQMTPMPARIAVITFNEGQMDLTRIGAPRNKEGTEWLVGQELQGRRGGEVLAPFVTTSLRPLIAAKEPLTMLSSVRTLLATNRHVRAAAPAPAAPTAVRASAPLLPTPLRDWKDATGRVMQASFESFTTPAKDTGRFKRADGQAFEVPFSRLSAEDQAFIRNIAQKQ